MIQNDWLKILFVEDSTETLANYSLYFKRYYKYFESASDGIEAYKKYQSFEPDVIFLDIKMEKMDGIEVLKRIRKHDHTTKVIMFTAYSEDRFVKKAVQLGCDYYLIKPVSREELSDTLAQVKSSIKNERVVS